jgi:hypothetical protein
LTTPDSGWFSEWGVDFHNQPMNEALILLTNPSSHPITLRRWSQVSSGGIDVLAAYLEPSRPCGQAPATTPTSSRVGAASTSTAGAECTLEATCPQEGALGFGTHLTVPHVPFGSRADVAPHRCAALIVRMQSPAVGEPFGILKGINVTYEYQGKPYVAEFTVARGLCLSVRDSNYGSSAHGCTTPQVFSRMRSLTIDAAHPTP